MLAKTITPDVALNRAKIRLMSTADAVFFTSVCFSLRFRWDETIPTAATDGKGLFVNTEFFMSLDTDEQVFLMLHESMHAAYLHMLRRGARDPQRWNAAADFVINLQLVQRGFKMPKQGLLDHGYDGMSVEQVYALLPEAVTLPWPDIMDCDGDPQNTEREMEDILVRAQLRSKMENDAAGTIPGDIEHFLNKLLEPKLPWQRILQKHMHAYSKDDYTFKKFNRRYFPQYILPGLRTEALMKIAIAVDISGSVSDEEFTQFITETHTIMRMMKPEEISFIQFDTRIQSVHSVKNVKELSQLTFTGRGGTMIEPVLAWVEEHKPQLTLIFTDGGFNFYRQDEVKNVTWLIHNNPGFKAPFGRVIHYNV